MKQKIIYLVLLLVGMHLLASSRQCSGIVKQGTAGILKMEADKKISPASAVEEMSDLPSPSISMLLFKL